MKQTVQTIAHTAMNVRDMEKSLMFYCDVVGMTRAFTLGDDKGQPWIQYLKITDGVFLELFYGGHDQNEPSYEEIGYHHLCLTTGDADALAKVFHEAGLADSPVARVHDDGCKSVWATDPDGNRLEFIQYSPDSPFLQCNEGAYDLDRKGLTGIGHVGYVMSDMEAALRFYRDQLGLSVILEADKDGKPWLKFLKVSDGVFVELFDGGIRQPEPGRNFAHLCLQCEDVRAAVEELRSRGVAIDIEPQQGKDTNTQAWIHDPDGNKIELMQINPASPQARA